MCAGPQPPLFGSSGRSGCVKAGRPQLLRLRRWQSSSLLCTQKRRALRLRKCNAEPCAHITFVLVLSKKNIWPGGQGRAWRARDAGLRVVRARGQVHLYSPAASAFSRALRLLFHKSLDLLRIGRTGADTAARTSGEANSAFARGEASGVRVLHSTCFLFASAEPFACRTTFDFGRALRLQF